MNIRNYLVETAIDIYLEEVASKEPFEPIRAVQVATWAQNTYQCKISETTVLQHLKRRAISGALVQTVSHSPYFEYHFYSMVNLVKGLKID